MSPTKPSQGCVDTLHGRERQSQNRVLPRLNFNPEWAAIRTLLATQYFTAAPAITKRVAPMLRKCTSISVPTKAHDPCFIKISSPAAGSAQAIGIPPEAPTQNPDFGLGASCCPCESGKAFAKKSAINLAVASLCFWVRPWNARCGPAGKFHLAINHQKRGCHASDPKTPAHHCFLCMQTVLGFIKNNRMRAVHNRACRLIIAMRGQAMHE